MGCGFSMSGKDAMNIKDAENRAKKGRVDNASLQIKAVEIEWDEIPPGSYLRSIEAIRNLEQLPLTRPVTFFVGENGSGKSTLLEAIAVAYGFNPEGGTLNYNFATHDSHSELWKAVRLVRGERRMKSSGAGFFLRAESFYNVATAEENYGQLGGKQLHLHERSHGESFLALAQEKFRPGGLYLLDEPEAALSPQRQMSFLIEVNNVARAGGQFIIATHSPIMLAIPGAEILSFDGGEIRPVNFEDTGCYSITEMFINHREWMTGMLFGGD